MSINKLIDDDCLTEIYQKYLNYMTAVAYDVLHNQSLSEDAIHNAIIYILENRDKIYIDTDNVSQTKAFLRIIVKHKAMDLKRHESKLEIMELNDAVGEPVIWSSPEETAELKERLTMATEYLSKLNDDTKEIFYMAANTKLTEKEIAKLLNMKEDNVYKIISRTRKKLHELLGDK